MLAVQEYLKTKTLDELSAELGIKTVIHPNLPLVILNYDQIESPKTAPIVRECRGLVLNTTDYGLVAKSMHRFFNWGEVAEEMKDFDFSDFCVQSKEDGSLVLLYHFQGEWHANTRGSFATDLMQFQNFTWRDGICKALNIKTLSDLNGVLDDHYTYVCEFVSPWNKIVRRYDQPALYLLTAFSGVREATLEQVDVLARQANFLRPILYEFHSIEEIQAFLQEQGANDPTFEGVVMRDCHGHRWKVKSATYLGLHRLKGEGDNLFNPKHLLPFVMSGEQDELLVYFPEVKQAFFQLKSEVQTMYGQMLEEWLDHKDIVEQKDFALAIKDSTKFASVLFTVRKKYGAGAKAADIRREWREADDQILKKIKFSVSA